MGEETKKTKVRLKICGSQFVITADESEQYIQKIAKMVDERVKYLDDSNPKLSLQMATIVAALNYCDQLEKERVITRELIKKADECETIARDSTLRLNKLLTENEQLREEKAGLHRVIAELKAGTYVEEQPYTDDYTPNIQAEEPKNSSSAVLPEPHKSISSPMLNSIKTTSAKLDSIKNSEQTGNRTTNKKLKNANIFLSRDEYASVVTDEEHFNLNNENG